MGQDLGNKVIARDYVEKNYIKKQDLLDFINEEMQVIEKREKETGDIRLIMDGITAAYNCILAKFDL